MCDRSALRALLDQLRADRPRTGLAALPPHKLEKAKRANRRLHNLVMKRRALRRQTA